jgi:NADH-quinone oxidoreductase subunit N
VENIAFLPIGPEVVLLAGAILVLMSAVALGRERREWGILAGITLAIAFLVAWAQWLRLDSLEVESQLAFSARGIASFRYPMVIMDRFSAFAGMLIFLVALLALVGNWRLIPRLGKRGAEYIALVLLAAAGLHMMVISSNLILMFMGLETASIALYVIAGFVRAEQNSDESALKYFLLGSFASAIFVYGIALVYAGTGTISIYGSGGIIEFFATQPVALFDVGILLTGIALMIVGLAFKISAAPFHQWAPDVYQGAASGSVALMSAGVKVAGIAALGRILFGAFPTRIDEWAPVLAVLAIVSVVVVAIGAIGQRDVKRMLAYSGVAHAGFMMTGMVAGGEAMWSVWFYLATYVVMLVGAFTVVSLVSGARSGSSGFGEWTGLWQRAPKLALAMGTFMLGMAGIPFFAGFVGKIVVFGSAINAGYLWLAIAGLVGSVVGLFFYLRLVVVMFFEEPALADAPGTATAGPRLSGGGGLVVTVCAFLTILFGIVPWPLLDLVRDAVL